MFVSMFVHVCLLCQCLFKIIAVAGILQIPTFLLSAELHHEVGDLLVEGVRLLLGPRLAVNPDTVLRPAGPDEAPALLVLGYDGINALLEAWWGHHLPLGISRRYLENPFRRMSVLDKHYSVKWQG